MERHYDFDLTYITERIISVFFLPDLEEQRYRSNLQEVASMLKSKHQDKFLVGHRSENIHNCFKSLSVIDSDYPVAFKCIFVNYIFANFVSLMFLCLFQLLNLSEKRHDITRLNPKVKILHLKRCINYQCDHNV